VGAVHGRLGCVGPGAMGIFRRSPRRTPTRLSWSAPISRWNPTHLAGRCDPGYIDCGNQPPFPRERRGNWTAASDRPSVCPRMEGFARGITSAPGELDRGRVSRSDRPPQPAGRVHRRLFGSAPPAHGQAPERAAVLVSCFFPCRAATRWQSPFRPVTAANSAGQVPGARSSSASPPCRATTYVGSFGDGLRHGRRGRGLPRSRPFFSRPLELAEEGLECRVVADRLEVGVLLEAHDVDPPSFLGLA